MCKSGNDHGHATATEVCIARVQAALNQQGFNKAAFAKKCNVPASAVKDMARPGWRPRSIENLIAVERALGLAAADPNPTGERTS